MDKLKKLSIIGLAIIVLSIGISSTVAAYDPSDYYYGSDEAAGWALFGLGLMCIIPLIMLIVGILIAIWVYRDAGKRGMSGILWALIVFFLGIIGLIIYLVVRGGHNGGLTPQQSGSAGRNCPSCGRPIPMDASVCPYCGKDFRPPR